MVADEGDSGFAEGIVQRHQNHGLAVASLFGDDPLRPVVGEDANQRILAGLQLLESKQTRSN